MRAVCLSHSTSIVVWNNWLCPCVHPLRRLLSPLLKHVFGTSTEGVYLHTRSDGQLFNLDRLRAKTKVRVTLIRDMLFADDGAVTSITEQQLQCLMDRFSQACKDFGLTISLKKTNVLGQDLDISPLITIDSYELDVVHLTLVPPSATTWATTCPGCRNQPAYREGHNNVGPTDNSFLGESQTDCGNQYSSERSVHHQYTPIRQWGMDNICQARAEAEQPPHAQPTPHPRNYMERKSCLMPRSLNALVSPTCTRCSDNEGCAGLATCAGWKMGAYRRTSSMARLPQARNL